jgi:uncharacterized protein with von Willebrand factor type A (vWA) domain
MLMVRSQARSQGDLAVGFAAELRRRGLVVPPDTVVAYARALDAVGLAEQEPVYWAGRATLVRRPEDAAAYDAAFAAYWEQTLERPVQRASAGTIDQLVAVEGAGDDDGDGEADGELRWSAAEVLHDKDLATLTDAERAEAHRLIDSLRLDAPRRRGRRRAPARRGDLDLRHTVSRALRTGGEPVRLLHEAPRDRARRVVLLLDVSGSMSSYARALLRFAHVAVRASDDVEVFALGTRLTRLTATLRTHDADAALALATASVPDYEGGTRLGDTVGEFTERFGVRGMARGAVLVILSDGWDRGQAEVLGEHMARLARVAHRIVWVNPLKSSPGYAPLAAGMAAALPHVDDFVEGHSLGSLESLADLLRSLSGRSSREGVGA